MVEIALRSVSVALQGRPVVHEVSATLGAGELVGVIGPNGAGKSTLVRAMLGLLPLAGGSIALDGVPIARLSRRTLARQLAYLPQGQTLYWPLSVERLVALGRLPHLGPLSRPGAADRAAIQAAMERTATLPLAGRDATRLSGGERARVMLARALAVAAPALLADEPLASLDPGHQIDSMNLLERERAAGTLVVAVLHDLGLAARYCSRLLLLDRGRLIADGPPMEVLTPARLRAVYGVDALLSAADGVPLVVPLRRSDP